MKLIQFVNESDHPKVGLVDQDQIYTLEKVSSTYELAAIAETEEIEIAELVGKLAQDANYSYLKIAEERRLLLPLSHPDPYHTWITGTGLTHLGSASSRNAMHQIDNQKNDLPITDSMRMFQMGVNNGRMVDDTPGVQPEWFYKGNGLSAVASGEPLTSPSFAMDAGEEPEIAAIYVINQQGRPMRIGFALGNEFSDHRMEKMNYLYLAHSKLRKCSYGPEILLSDLPDKIVGRSRIWRKDELLWEKEFLTGEAHMSHNLANLEYHHFKYDLFRQPGDVHIHFLGTSVLSFADQIVTQSGDKFEISANCFDHPLINTLEIES